MEYWVQICWLPDVDPNVNADAWQVAWLFVEEAILYLKKF
jgi:hypothetical protein